MFAITHGFPLEGQGAGACEHGMKETVQCEYGTSHEGEEHHLAAPSLVRRPPLGEAVDSGKRYRLDDAWKDRVYFSCVLLAPTL